MTKTRGGDFPPAAANGWWQGDSWDGGGDLSPSPPLTPCPAPPASEACCELCGLYFENRKALASHARAHLRQFGVTEWCVNGSPIETLSEWIRHRPQKAGAYRSYIQGGRPFTKKFRNSSHARDHDGTRRMPLSLQPGGVALLSKGLAADLAHGEPGKILDGGSGGERPMVTSPLSLVKMEEHQRPNIHSELGASQQRGGSSTRGSWQSAENPLPHPLCPSLGRGGNSLPEIPPAPLFRDPVPFGKRHVEAVPYPGSPVAASREAVPHRCTVPPLP